MSEKTPPVDEQSDKPKATYKLSRKDWEEAKAMWGSGDFTLAQIAERFSVSVTAIQQRFKRNGVVKGQDAKVHKKALHDKIARKVDKRVEELAEIALDGAITLAKGSLQISKLMLFEVQDARNNKQQIHMRHANIRALLDVQRGLSVSQTTLDSIVGLKPEEDLEKELPELVVDVITQEEIDLMREQQRLADALEGEDIDQDLDLMIEGGDESEVVSG